MNIGVDMDSVIAEIIRPIDAFHNRKYYTNIVYEDHTSYDLQQLWKCSIDEVLARIFEFYQSPEFNTIAPIKGSQNALKELSKKHNLHLITARPYDIEEKTKRWIGTYYPKLFTSIKHTNQISKKGKGRSVKKSHLCKELKVDIMIDDHIVNALDCADNEIHTLLFERPWNSNYKIPHPYIKKVSTWEEVWYTISHESEKPHL